MPQISLIRFYSGVFQNVHLLTICSFHLELVFKCRSLTSARWPLSHVRLLLFVEYWLCYRDRVMPLWEQHGYWNFRLPFFSQRCLGNRLWLMCYFATLVVKSDIFAPVVIQWVWSHYHFVWFIGCPDCYLELEVTVYRCGVTWDLQYLPPLFLQVSWLFFPFQLSLQVSTSKKQRRSPYLRFQLYHFHWPYYSHWLSPQELSFPLRWRPPPNYL